MATSFLQFLSYLFGWIYTTCWSFSFYPQPLLNYKRKSTSGAAIDFPFLNVIGFAAYFVSTVSFLYSPEIRREYALRNNGHTPTVQFNDLAFAAHAFFVCCIIMSQYHLSIWKFDKRGKRGPGSRISTSILGLAVACIAGVATSVVIVLARKDEDVVTGWAWIDVVYVISYVKLIITTVKYMPQVLTNYRNRSTTGWAIGGILLDFSGGVLSILQLGIDSYLQGDWSGIAGNPVKLMLGNVSIFFDVIFIVQHYILYRGNGRDKPFNEEDPLLEPDREQRID
ncbi:fb7b4858-83a0-4856-bba9-e12b862abcc5 [Sclerotinia trifoliorum]|uniref:Fb7b4858-83a0-4856-bba9-e12b862abcc5 n=1 Tax=Sclerotinia trifoliorum TaxID=28548 RepID=A0A8H2ZRE0_9HELO|nr:fb7b4858-83a0-4856-bba9-e12b862abcc5 [Sclerotinia trifoliorum]